MWDIYLSHDRKVKFGLRVVNNVEFVHLKIIKEGQGPETIPMTILELQELSKMELAAFTLGSTWRVSNGRRSLEVSLMDNDVSQTVQLCLYKYKDKEQWQRGGIIDLTMNEYGTLLSYIPEVLENLRIPPTRPVFRKIEGHVVQPITNSN